MTLEELAELTNATSITDEQIDAVSAWLTEDIRRFNHPMLNAFVRAHKAAIMEHYKLCAARL